MAELPRWPWPAVVPVWGPELPIAFLSPMLAASVSNHCCWQDFAGPNTEVRAKLKRIGTSAAAAAWLRSALTLLRDVCLMHDPDPCSWAAKSSGASILASAPHNAPPCRDRGALGRGKQPQILAKTGTLSLINPPVYPSSAFSNLSPLIFPLPFLLQEWIYPKGDYS